MTLCYLIASFVAELPWTDGPAHDFFLWVQQPSSSVVDGGGLVPHLTGAYIVVWLIVTISAAKDSSSIELLNKIVMPVPFLVLLVFLVRGLTLEGAGDGVIALLTPDPSKLFTVEIWITAISQLFFGVSAGMGVLTTYASFNPSGTPIVKSALIVCLANSGFSLLAGVTVFAFLGHLAHERQCSITDVVEGGSSLAFEVFPVAFASLPWPHFWAVSFFLMLLNLGISSAVSMTSPLAIAVTEALQAAGKLASGSDSTSTRAASSSQRRSRCAALCLSLGFTPSMVPTLLLHLFGVCSGLLYVTHGGAHWVDLGDHFLPLYLTCVVGLGECILISRFYGARRLLNELPKADRKYGVWWRFCWIVLNPIALTLLLIAQIVGEFVHPFGTPPPEDSNSSTMVANASVGGHCDIANGVRTNGTDVPSMLNATQEVESSPYPPWATLIGWLLALGPTALAPCCAVYALLRKQRKASPMMKVSGVTKVSEVQLE